MKERIKLMGTLLLAAALCAGLAGCGGGGLTASDATVYVQGLMDRTYLGQYNQDYMDLVGVTEEEMEQNYEDGIQVEAEFFCYYFEIEDASEELMEEIRAFYRELYSHAKYTVSPASKLSTGGYAVEVVVSPLNVITLMNDSADQVYETIDDLYGDKSLDEMSDAERAQFEQDWGRAIVDLAYDVLPQVGYEEDVYLTVQVKQDESDGMWTLVDTDFDSLDAAIIAY